MGIKSPVEISVDVAGDVTITSDVVVKVGDTSGIPATVGFTVAVASTAVDGVFVDTGELGTVDDDGIVGLGVGIRVSTAQ